MPSIHRESVAPHHLDFIRGMAALAVVAFHIRYRFFLDYADLDTVTPATKVFYAATSFGHDAVMVFFVLSGYLISSSVIRDCQKEQWSWSRYSSNRLIRLYLVLVPGLFLTIFWDVLGLRLFPDNAIYTGAVQPWRNDFFDVSARLNSLGLLGNLAFLQTIRVSPLGSNDPLWSLAYEFWYYVLFPLAVLGIGYARSGLARLAYCVLAIAIAFTVGRSIMTYFPIWLLGTLVLFAPRITWFEGKHSTLRVVTLVSAGLFVLAAVMGHTHSVKERLWNSTVIMDYMAGGAFALFLYFLVHDDIRENTHGYYERIARLFASISYTLYVVHMPLLVFLRAMLVESKPWTPSLGNMIVACGIGLIVVIYAILVARLTEAKTESVRHLVGRILGIGPQKRGSIVSPVPSPDNCAPSTVSCPAARLNSRMTTSVKECAASPE